MWSLLLSACAPEAPVSPTQTAPDSVADSEVDTAPPAVWPDPILRVAEVEVDVEGMELTDAVVAGDRLVLLGQQQQAQGGVWLFELSDPDHPSFLDKTELWHVQSGCWDGERLWGVDRMSTLRRFDISGDKPEVLRTFNIGGPDGAVDCAPGRLAWGRGTGLGAVARVEEGDLPEIWPLDEEVVGVAIDADTVWTASTGWLRAWRWDGASAPALVSSVPLDGACRDIALKPAVLAVACGSEGVHLVSRNPDEPEVLGTWDGAASARAVAIDGDTLLVAGWTDLLAVDISNPAAPTLIGAEAAASSVMGLASGGDGRVYVADWRHPFVAQVVGGQAPELRLSPSVPAPGDVVGVYNDGPVALRLEGVSHGSLDAMRVEPGSATSWALPSDLEPDSEVRLLSNDPDEAEASLRVASLGALTVGEPAPEFYEFDLDGQLYSTDSLRGEIVFLGLFSEG